MKKRGSSPSKKSARCFAVWKLWLGERAAKHRFTRHLVSDYGFRTLALAGVSFAMNIGFAVLNGVLGIISHSVWYGSLAAYYLLLSGIRLGVLIGSQRAKKMSDDEAGSLRRKLLLLRNCGVALFVLETALTVSVTQMVLSNPPVQHSEILAIASAVYTFYKMTLSAINFVKAGRLKEPVVQSMRNIGFAEASVSVLSLQVTLIAVFSETGEAERLLPLNAVTGFTVCALVLALGAVMIVQANKRLKILRNGGWNRHE